MDWVLKGISQETDHKHLNLFTFHYAVVKEGKETDYPYFVASRRSKGKLTALTHDFARPDGVLIAAIKEGKDPSLLIIEEFRPAIGSHIIAFPAGLMDEEDTDVTETAIREAEEEAGVRLEDIRLLCPPSPTSAGLSDENVAVVEGKVSALSETHLEMFEDINARFVSFKELRNLLEDKTVVIALNVRLCMLYLLERYERYCDKAN